MYFEVHLLATEFTRKTLATAAPFVWLCTVDPQTHRGIGMRKAECRFLFLRLRNSFLTSGGLFCCHPYQMTLVLGFATVG
jgi:hypothetical protein